MANLKIEILDCPIKLSNSNIFTRRQKTFLIFTRRQKNDKLENLHSIPIWPNLKIAKIFFR